MTKLVCFAGPPCTGKSTIGEMLPEFVHLEMDKFRWRLLPGALHTRADREVAYRGMHYAAELLLGRGLSVICNGGYTQAEARAELLRIAGAAAVYVVEFTAPVEVALARNERRQGRHAGLDLTEQRVRDLFATYPWREKGCRIDSTQPAAECVAQVREYLGGPVSPAPDWGGS